MNNPAPKIKESELQRQIIQALSYTCEVFRANVGQFKVGDRYVRTGLPKGFPDIFGYRRKDGKFFAIEIKTKTGKLSYHQKVFQNFFGKEPILYGVARSIEDALAIVGDEEVKQWKK